MPRKKAHSPDALLDEALSIMALELRRIRRCQRAGFLTEEDGRQLVRMANCLRETEADRNRPWDPRKLARMTEHELELAIAADKAASQADKDGN